MSAKLVKAHGGSRTMVKGEATTMGGIIHDTTHGLQKDVHMKHLDRLVSKTTGVPLESPVLAGVITRTTPHEPITPEFHKLPSHEVGKTQARSMGQVPYAGKEY